MPREPIHPVLASNSNDYPVSMFMKNVRHENHSNPAMNFLPRYALDVFSCRQNPWKVSKREKKSRTIYGMIQGNIYRKPQVLPLNIRSSYHISLQFWEQVPLPSHHDGNQKGHFCRRYHVWLKMQDAYANSYSANREIAPFYHGRFPAIFHGLNPDSCWLYKTPSFSEI